ncbi:MAG: DUF11 domain-containing protein, partial [Saprospiraceae bacterium]|nr:DUF11 domain-containing protein [Saprospiraceae bacterium]
MQSNYFSKKEDTSFVLRKASLHLTELTMRKSLTLWSRSIHLLFGLLLFTGVSFAQNDLSLTKTVSADSVGCGDTVTYTLIVINEGLTSVTGVTVCDTLPDDVILIGTKASSGSYNSSSGIWDIGSISDKTISDTLELVVVINGEGVFINTAEIKTMNEVDDDSTPGNTDYNEDDIATSCVSVPIRICPTLSDTVRMEAPPGLTNYQWFDGVTLLSADSIYFATAAGSYTWTADSVISGCSAGLCCPIVLKEECFDLALLKTYISTSNLSVIDYAPTGLTLVPDGLWFAGPNNTAVAALSPGTGLPVGGLDGGQSTSVDIQFTVDSPLAAGKTLTNFAEIGFAFGDTFTFVEDVDSDPDSFNDDVYLIDNYIDGNGRNGGDEDDHDAASVTVESFDLALYKVLAPSQVSPVAPGGYVTFRIYVVNQGDITADNIELIDYIPSDMTLADGNWAASGSNATRILNAGDELPVGGLASGETVWVDILLQINTSLASTISDITNYAEISSATDGSGNPQTDVDSDPDQDATNDVTLSDNNIDGNGKNGGDEDDFDGAVVEVAVFDLALVKELATGQSSMVAPGDTVTFTVTLFNQGDISTSNLSVIDYAPTGLTLVPDGLWFAGPNNTAVAALSPGTGLPVGGLDGGQSTSVDIQFTVDSPLAAGTTLTNFAEIGFAFGGTFTFVQDVDSDPDSFNDDLYLIDNYIDGNGRNGGDEDDHDAASVTVESFDL